MEPKTDMIQFWKDAHDRACELLQKQEGEMADMKAAIATAEAIWRGEESKLLVQFVVALLPLEPDATKAFSRAHELVAEFKRLHGANTNDEPTRPKQHLI